jgi:hypothetical protein
LQQKEALSPPFLRDLCRNRDVDEYSWCKTNKKADFATKKATRSLRALSPDD